MDAAGGGRSCSGCVNYAPDPEGNLAPTGRHLFFERNLGGSRMDASLVRISLLRLTRSSSTTAAPSVSIASPSPGSSVSGAARRKQRQRSLPSGRPISVNVAATIKLARRACRCPGVRLQRTPRGLIYRESLAG